ncbi:MAG: hypothetical protein FWH06_06555 [Oscillospiraceae bacterium]|nr:hypothetical protein [Oscillospiraceae bacterium]
MFTFDRRFFDDRLTELGMTFNDYLRTYARSAKAFNRWDSGKRIYAVSVELIACDLRTDWRNLTI